MAGPKPEPERIHWMDRLGEWIARSELVRINRRTMTASGVMSVVGFAAHELHAGGIQARVAKDSLSVLSDAVTAEGLLVTVLGVARTRATELTLDEATVRLIRAAQCEEEAHFNNLVAAGASPAASQYTIPDGVLQDPTSFLATWIELEQIMVGMYMTAARQFAGNGDFDLVEIAYQIGTVEAQHLALVRQLTGERLPADRAFAKWQFRQSAEAVDRLKQLGFIEGKATAYDYPGPGDRYCRGITGLVAETTSDQTPPDVTPAPRREGTPPREQSEASPVSDT